MKENIFIIFFSLVITAFSQNITVDSQSYAPQQLIEDILIDSNCISNVVVTNTVGGNFNGSDQSYGYFDATGTSFPFQSGIVLSTGKLNNVKGPNTTLSDDNAPNWSGDSDLEAALNENNTINATIIEFDFTSVADQISFRYIFASEEYQDGNANTCQYSDLFGFLIRPVNSQDYTNIALVPNTNTPVKVTTVHPEIPGGCQAENEAYFESFNSNVSPINFNGQTKILTAIANTIPNETYHVKLVIADEQNYRYDSAVFLEAGSFQLNTDLGPNLLTSTNSALCEGETYVLNAIQSGLNSYSWFKDDILVYFQPANCINCGTYTVTEAGTYNVEVTLANGCISYGEVTIEYGTNPTVFNSTLFECDINQDGFTTYNLFNATQNITNNDSNLSISAFYTSFPNNVIAQPEAFDNTNVLQTVYANVIDQTSGCSALAEITLDISTNTLTLQPYNTCDDEVVDGLTSFNLNDIRSVIETLVPANANISFYTTIEDAFTETSSINGNFTNTTPNSEDIYVKVTTDTNQCYAITSLTLNVLFTPELLANESFIYCLNSFPESLTLVGGVINGNPSNFYYQWLFNGNDTGTTTSFINANEIGIYTVIVTDPNGCFNSRDITLIPSNEPTVESLQFTELTSNNTATITVSGEGTYEYALDNENGFYQNENSFSGLEPGFHTIYIRDENGCGSISKDFSILGLPQFFTPNGDSKNDVWKPIGVNSEFNANLKILIFNRYGKLLQATNPIIGWNGTLNGLALPSDDYWYLISHPSGKQYSGHFALKR